VAELLKTNFGSVPMVSEEKRDGEELLPEFGVSRCELEADVKRRVASLDAGLGLTTEQLRAKLLLGRQQRKIKKNSAISR
jgi:hypothetical protein